MSGITERIEAKLDHVIQLLSQQPQQPAVQQPIVQPLQPVQQPVQQQPDPLSFQQPVQQQPVQQAVSNEMLTALIQPHLANPAIKAAMQGVLAQMNIPGLPQAREDQYAELYQRFSAVIQQASAQQPAQAGNVGASPLNSGGGVSIL